jgi:hypothetical protein
MALNYETYPAIFVDDSVKIRETPETLVLEGSTEFNTTYGQFFTQTGGKIIETTATTATWSLPKSPVTTQIINRMVGFNIEDKYSLTPAPAPAPAPITVGGMSFPSMLTPGLTTGSNKSPLSPPTFPAGLGSHGLTTAPRSTAGEYAPPPPPFPTTATVGGAYSPATDRPPATLIGGGEAQGWWIYDYTDASIAVFVGKEAYEAGGGDCLKQAGGKSTRLTPDGPGTTPRSGWIFAKSNANGMNYLSHKLVADI